MAINKFRIPAMVLTFALLAAPAATFAQSEVPAREGPVREGPVREGNVWDWRDHQPTEVGVSRKEKAEGVAPTSSQRESDSTTVDTLYRQLMQQERR
jgi:hypothetical protein